MSEDQVEQITDLMTDESDNYESEELSYNDQEELDDYVEEVSETAPLGSGKNDAESDEKPADSPKTERSPTSTAKESVSALNSVVNAKELPTIDEIGNAWNDLTEATQQLNTLRQSNQITEDQYQAAWQNSQRYETHLHGLYNQRQGADFHNQREQETNVQKYHESVFELIPEWRDQDVQNAEVEQLLNYLEDNGISRQEASNILEPAQIAFALKQMKSTHSKVSEQVAKTRRAERGRRTKTKNSEKVVDRGTQSIESKTNEIAQLLGGM